MATTTPTLYAQIYAPSVLGLKNLSAILSKAEKFADENSKKHEDIINFRLIEDMRGLSYQVQSCSNTIKWLLVRLDLMEDRTLEDNEATFAELQHRITTTIDLLGKHASKPEQWAGREQQPVLMKTGMGTFKFDDGQQYVSRFALPNFHFHLTSAYCILRHLGVPLSAFDYLGKETFVKVEK